MSEHEHEPVDPQSGEPREAADAASGAAPEGTEATPTDATPAAGDDDLSPEDRALLDGEASSMAAELDAAKANATELLDELQRLKADFVNYRNRIERDRANDRTSTIGEAVRTLMPALDDLELADKHGDLEEGPLAIVAQKLRGGFDQLGVSRVGEVGEVFDIDKHEAVAQLPNPEVTEMVVADVIQIGWRVGDRLLRAAKVAVFVPAE